MTLALSTADRERVAAIAALEAGLPATVASLVACLDEPSWPVRRVAVAALARAGDAAVGPLCAVLEQRGRDESRLAAAVDALSTSTGDVDAAVITLGDGGTAPVTVDAAQILGRRRSAAAVPTLERWVAHEDDNVSVAAMEALGRIGGGAGIDAVVRAASSGKFFRAYPAVDLLARSGDPRAVAPLEALLDDPLCGPEAARGLARIGDVGTASVLARKLARGSAVMTRLAARALVDVVGALGARFGTDQGALATVRAGLTEQTAAAIARALPGSDADERLAMARVLGWVGTSEAAALLVAMLPERGAVAAAAAEALSGLGAGAADALLATLARGPSEQRRLLLPLLGASLRDEDAVAACLTDPEPDVRALAATTAARTQSTAAVPKLFELLGDPDPKVTQAALGAIQSLGHSATEPLTLHAARSSSTQVRRAALRLLGAFGWPSGLEPLIEAAHGGDSRLSDAAIASLPFLDDPQAREALLALARSDVTRARAAAVRALGNLGADAEVLAALEAAVSDEAPWVRYYAAQALGRLRASDRVAAIAALLHDPVGHVRIAAIEALSHLPDPASTRALVEATHADDPDLRRAALVGLGMARPTEARGVLLEALDDPDAATRIIAVGSVAAFEGDDVLAALASAARGEDRDVRDAAIGALAATPGRAATRALIGLAADEALTQVALTALGTPVVGRIPTLLEALETSDAPTAARLTAALARMKRPDARAALAVALAMACVHARRAAAAALAVVASRETAGHLERALAADPDPEVRRLAAYGLGRR